MAFRVGKSAEEKGEDDDRPLGQDNSYFMRPCVAAKPRALLLLGCCCQLERDQVWPLLLPLSEGVGQWACHRRQVLVHKQTHTNTHTHSSCVNLLQMARRCDPKSVKANAISCTLQRS